MLTIVMNNPPLVVVEWVDSAQPTGTWQWLDDINVRAPHRCLSVGFLLQDNEHVKVLAANVAACSGRDDWDQASGVMTIPTTAVRKLSYLSARPSLKAKTSAQKGAGLAQMRKET